jgi:SNF2 family DNA or RNA helicase
MYKEDWPVVVICPTSLKFNWKAEILKWLKDDINEQNIQILATAKSAIYKTSKFLIGKWSITCSFIWNGKQIN